VVAGSEALGTGRCELHLIAAPETAATRLAPDWTKKALEEIGELSDGALLEEAREEMAALVEELLGLEDSRTSEIVAEVLWEVGEEAHDLGAPSAASRAWERVHDHRQRVLPSDHRDLQAARVNLAIALWDAGELEGALALEERVLEVRSRTLPGDDPALQNARWNLGLTRQALGDLSGARELIEKVLEVRSRQLDETDPSLQQARRRLAGILHGLRDFHGARSVEEKALEAKIRTRPEDDAEVQEVRLQLASTCFALGDWYAARELQEQVVAVRTRTSPADDPHLQEARADLAGTLAALGNLQDALVLRGHVLESLARGMPEGATELQIARVDAASTLRDMGRLDEAEVLFEEALECLTRTLPADNDVLSWAQGEYAYAIKEKGDLERAREMQESILATYSRTHADDHPDLAHARHYLAETLARLREQSAFHAAALSFMRGFKGYLSQIPLGSPREADEGAFRQALHASLALSSTSGGGVFAPDPVLEREAFAATESARCAGIVAAALARLARADPDCGRLWQEVLSSSLELGRLDATNVDRLVTSRQRRDRAQRELISLVSESAAGRKLLAEPWPEALAARLDSDQVLVGFWRYTRCTLDPDDPNRESLEESLLAHVVGPDGSLIRVELGPIEPIAQAVESWRAEILAPMERGASVVERKHGEATAAEELRARILDPLRFASSEPDGSLWPSMTCCMPCRWTRCPMAMAG
jgi:tetratricopeptide (TPR) repeat protein